MKNIDRWVFGASMSFAANRKAACIFVRVSKDTILDKSVVSWLETQLRSLRSAEAPVHPGHRGVATQYVRQTTDLSEVCASSASASRSSISAPAATA